jgi:2-polyprenyl-3-methyl-5-hydroxy-6-metoxy-1,4-benzoquinol methylase
MSGADWVLSRSTIMPAARKSLGLTLAPMQLHTATTNASAATKFNRTFDLIHCFDVLYHLTDEQGWRATLEAFAQVSHPGTIWVFTEFRVYKTRTAAPHMVKRSTDTYRTELALYGRQIVEETPLYWLYSAWPWLGQRIPSLISKVEWLGRFFGGLFPHESVVLWVIQE